MPSFQVNHRWAKLSRINDHLFIGGVVALKANIIEANKISCIINATAEVPTLLFPGVKSTKLWLQGTLDTDLSPYFNPIADQIQLVHEMGGTTLVHCVAGVSRSAAFCLAYLMKYGGKTLREAYLRLALLRPMVQPNLAFWKQLVAFELSLYGRTTINFVKISGSDQCLPDVYVVKSTILEEDEEEDEVMIAEDSSGEEGSWSRDGNTSDDMISNASEISEM